MAWPLDLFRRKSKETPAPTAEQMVKDALAAPYRRIPGIDFPVGDPPPLDVPIYGYSGWGVAQVQNALDQIKVGTLIAAHQLLLEMQEDPVFSHGFDLRVKSLVETEFTLEKPLVPTSPEYERAFEILVRNWQRVFNENDLAQSAKYRVPLGVAPATVRWWVEDGCWLPEIRIKETGNIVWYQYENRFKFLSLNNGLITIENDGAEWVLFIELASKYPYLDGSIRPLATWWWVKQATMRYMHNFARVNGQPWKKVKCPAPQRETEDFRQVLLQAQSLQDNGTFAAPQYKDGPSFDLELVETKGTGEVFDKIINRADDYMTLRLTGALDNSRGGNSGSRARAEVHELQTNKYLGSDCRVTAAAIQKVLHWWCRYNRFPLAWVPKPVFHYEPPKDERDAAETRRLNSDALKNLAETLPALEAKLQEQSPGSKVDYKKLLLDSGVPVTDPGEQSVPIDLSLVSTSTL